MISGEQGSALGVYHSARAEENGKERNAMNKTYLLNGLSIWCILEAHNRRVLETFLSPQVGGP